jgi:hypothetical protein
LASAFVFVTCGFNQSALVQKRVKQVHGVQAAKLTNGVYDLIIEVQSDNQEKLMRVVDDVKLVSGVRFALTSVIQSQDNR